MKQKVSVDVRVDASTKARWQADADAAGLTVGELVRRRMQIDTPRLREGAASVDLAAGELQPLRSWLDLRDSDGSLDAGMLADWRGFAGRHGITFEDLLERVVVEANAALA